MGLTPYPFQRRVATWLISGRNVILQAPTGAGKTLAAMLPFLDALEHDRDFPHKCLYAVPLRVLANQFGEEYTARVRRAGRDERIRVAIQTGERREDRDLTATLTFATIDQVLSSFLHMPYSQPKRQWNLNAAAVVSSYLVFDEFHLFDPDSTLPTTLEMLRMLKGVAPMLLMTATFSPEMLGELARLLDAVVVPEDDAAGEEMLQIPVQRDKRRFYHWRPEPLSADAVLREHGTRSIVVCNTVDRARALFEGLQRHPARGDTQLLLLHSHFLKADRQRIEAELLCRFGKDADPSGRWIIVATQAIEVGLDLSATHLHTELAPANAVLQRAGRCARYGGEGHVFVYDIESELPYTGMTDEFERTRSAFQERDGTQLTFADEQVVVAAVHGPRDRAVVEGLKASRSRHRAEMNVVLRGEADRAGGSRLIRDIVARDVIVHPNPDELLTNPWQVEAFSLYPGSLYGAAKVWVEREVELDLEWGVMWLREAATDESEGGRHVERWWERAWSSEDLRGAPLVVVNPALAGYDPQRGFLLHEPTGFVSPPVLRQKTEQYTRFYRLESYERHISLVWQALVQDTWPELAAAAARLEQRAGWQPGVLVRAAHLVALLHDVGKLNKALQRWYHNWQRAIGAPAPDAEAIAHTDYDELNPLHIEKERAMSSRRPPHAVEGAVAVAPLLVQALDPTHLPIIKAAFSAIARHHGPFSREFRAFELIPGATAEIARTLQLAPHLAVDVRGLRSRDTPDLTQIDRFWVDESNDNELLAYMLLARALRRADQLGTEWGAQAADG
ncbi:MAG TPA: CRISPR-associated helicase Cas3' [Chloroflexi bacterium]|nr:CRISPR-associated helicase Cas3' [Chloroflexota bacterium]